ncbi:hypothetical protein Tco_0885447 [Tanacetum coccineum]
MAPTTRRGPNTPVNDTNPNNMTPESVQAMIDQALLRNSTNGDGSHSSHGDNRRNVQTARPCFYADFMKCQPLNFKGAEGVVGLTRWIEKMESVFNISGCAVENQVPDISHNWEYSKKEPGQIFPHVKSRNWQSKKAVEPKSQAWPMTLMDLNFDTYAERQSDNTKGRLIFIQNPHGHQKATLQKARMSPEPYNWGQAKEAIWGDLLPKCTSAISP